MIKIYPPLYIYMYPCVSIATSVDSVKAVVEIVSGDPRIFSGESVRLKCSISDVRSTWDYLWFRGSERLPPRGEHLLLWRTHIKQSGNYYCQGVRDSAVGDIHTSKSLPVEINVDGKILFICIITDLLGSHVKGKVDPKMETTVII